MNAMIQCFLLLGLAVAAAGCNSDDDADGSTTSPSAGDMGPMPDGGGLVDGGGVSDGGPPPDGGPLPDGGGVRATGQLGPEGGAIRVIGDGPIAELNLTLPEGVLMAGEQATVTLELKDSNGEGEPIPAGAFDLGYFRIGIEPIELAQRIAGDWEVNATLAILRAPLPDAYRALAEESPDDWLNGRLIFVEDLEADQVLDSLGDVATGKCSGSRLRTRFNFKMSAPTAGPGRVPNSVVLTLPDDATRPLNAVAYRNRRAANGGLVENKVYIDNRLWVMLKPAGQWEYTPGGDDSHIGPVVLEYFPLSRISVDPAVFLQIDSRTGTSPELARVKRCYGSFLETLDAILSESRFRPIRTELAGKPLPVHVQIYDYSDSPDVTASAHLAKRTMTLPTKFLNLALDAAGDGSNCVADAQRVQARAYQLASMAHEFFHIQQAAYFLPHRPEIYVDALAELDKAIDQPIPLRVAGEMTGVLTGWQRDRWFMEGSARYFERVLFPTVEGYPPWAALSAYPIYGPAFNIFAGQLIDSSGWYNYNRWFFFKFLLDQEGDIFDAGEPGYPELERLSDLMNHMGHFITRREFVDYRTMVQSWLSLNRIEHGWFDFFRELSLLRGCGALGTCDAIDPGLRHPFARGRADSPDFFGEHLADEGVFWSFWDEGLPNFFDYRDRRYIDPPAWLQSGVSEDNGRSLRHARCFFDTTLESYFVEPDNVQQGDGGIIGSTLIGSSGEGGRFSLSPLLQGPQSGMRVDFFDDISRGAFETHTWEFEFGPAPDCPDTVRYELWSHDRHIAGAVPERRASGVLSEGRGFSLEMDAGAVHRVHTLLVGNDVWGDLVWPSLAADRCEVRVVAVPHDLRCGPCVDFPTTRSGPPDDVTTTMFCLWHQENGREHRNELCHDGGPNNPGGLHTILDRPEFEDCWNSYAHLFMTVCDIDRARFVSLLDAECASGEETVCTCCEGDPVQCDPWPEPPVLCP